MFNFVELMTDEQHDSPCKHGNIVDGHACYCHAPTDETPRKCPIWRDYGEHDLGKWRRGTWDEGACPFFAPNGGDELPRADAGKNGGK